MIIGAGKMVRKLQEKFDYSQHQYSIAGFVDDNLDKTGAFIHVKKYFENKRATKS